MFEVIFLAALLPSTFGFGEEINTTDAAGNPLEHFRVQNFNPSPIFIHELLFAEYVDDYLIQEIYWHDIPPVLPRDETLMIPYGYKAIENKDSKQKWTIILQYENNTYITKEPIVTKLTEDDQGHLTRIVLDLVKDRMQVKPPVAPLRRVDLKMKKGRLNDATTESLMKDIADLKAVLKAFLYGLDG